jgi:hypothetical protein
LRYEFKAVLHESHNVGSIVPALAKNARAGHPRFKYEAEGTKGWATRQGWGTLNIAADD